MTKFALKVTALAVLCCLFSCVSPRSDKMTALLKTPEEAHIYSVFATSLAREAYDAPPEVKEGFPFVSSQPGAAYRGRFSPEFYAGALKRFRSASLQEVDFWGLKKNPRLYDVIYVKPMVQGEFKFYGDDLLESIAYSYNISREQLAILNDWIRKGGTLWMESGIFVSTYDYKFDRFSDDQLEKFLARLKGLRLFDHKLTVFMLRAKKTDDIHVKNVSLEIPVGTPGNVGEIREINEKVRSLLLEQSDYIGIYPLAEASPIVQSGNKVYASFLKFGKGTVITLPPFDFQNAYHDGELFRLTLLSWALKKKK